jgi:acetyl-CoA C-acetyltransferase
VPDVFVLEHLRTPRAKGTAKGSLHHLSPVHLVVHLQRALVERTGIDPATVDDVALGTASQVDEQGANLARTATLLAGWDAEVPGVTLNRFCASGIDAVAQTAARIRGGDLDLAVAGGVESVSRVPMFSDRGPLWTDPGTIHRIGSVHMGIAADLNATLDGWTRPELDAYGAETHAKAARAWEEGFYDRAVVPVPRADGTLFAVDELIRRDTTVESLAALPPAFADLGASGQDAIALAARRDAGPIDHQHTVGTSPALADAAALVLLGSARAAEAAGLRPRARVLAAATAGTDPVIMLTAGQLAVGKLLARAGLRSADIDVFEFAEAFSALCLRFRRDLSAGPDRLNPNGGTIAMGHAFGATGAILIGGCVDELERRQGRYGVAAVSGAAGLGVALLLERVAT